MNLGGRLQGVFVLLTALVALCAQSDHLSVAAVAIDGRTSGMKWTAAPLCEKKTSTGACCCAKRDGIPVIRTAIKNTVVTKKTTSTVLKTVYTSTKTITKVTGAALARREIEEERAVEHAISSVPDSSDYLEPRELDNEIARADLPQEEVLVSLDRRNLCQRCPVGAVLVKSGGSPCCPPRKTITKTKTRVSTTLIKKTTIKTIRAVATKVVPGRVQDISGQLFFDLNADGVYGPGDLPLANEPISLVVVTPSTYLARRALSVLSKTNTTTTGSYTFTNVTLASNTSLAVTSSNGTILQTGSTNSSGLLTGGGLTAPINSVSTTRPGAPTGTAKSMATVTASTNAVMTSAVAKTTTPPAGLAAKSTTVLSTTVFSQKTTTATTSNSATTSNTATTSSETATASTTSSETETQTSSTIVLTTTRSTTTSFTRTSTTSYTRSTTVYQCNYKAFGQAAPSAASYHPAGNILAVGDAQGTIRLWNVATSSQVGRDFRLSTNNAYITGIAWHPSGTKMAVSTGYEYSVEVYSWDGSYSEGIGSHTFHTDRVGNVVWVGDTQIASVSDDRQLLIWDHETQEIVGNYTFGDGLNSALAYSNVTKKIAVSMWYGYVTVLNFDNGVLSSPVNLTDSALSGSDVGKTHSENVLSMSFNKAGTKLVTGGQDNKIKLWDMTQNSGWTPLTRSSMITPDNCTNDADDGGWPNALAYNSDDSYIAVSGSRDVFLLNPTTLAKVGQLADPRLSYNNSWACTPWAILQDANQYDISFVAPHPSNPNKISAGGNDGKMIRIWDTTTQSSPALTGRIGFYESTITSLSPSLDGSKLLATTNSQRGVLVLGTQTDTNTWIDPDGTGGPLYTSYATNSTTFVTAYRDNQATDANLKLYNASTGAFIARIEDPTYSPLAWQGDVRTMSLSSDGRFLIVGDRSDDYGAHVRVFTLTETGGSFVCKIDDIHGTRTYPRKVIAIGDGTLFMTIAEHENDEIYLRTVKIWNSNDCSLANEFTVAPIDYNVRAATAVNRNGTLAAYPDPTNNNVEIRTISDNTLVATLPDTNSEYGSVITMDWSPDGTRLAMGRDEQIPNRIQIWDVASQTIISEEKHLPQRPMARTVPWLVRWHPGGNKLFVATQDTYLMTMDICNGP